MRVEFFEDGMPCVVQRTLVKRGHWHLLVGCLLLNRTTRAQAKAALSALFALAESPEELRQVCDADLLAVLAPCGLGNRRLLALRRLTEDVLLGLPINQIRHCGPYARASFEIFIENCIPPRTPVTDKELLAYLNTHAQ